MGLVQRLLQGWVAYFLGLLGLGLSERSKPEVSKFLLVLLDVVEPLLLVLAHLGRVGTG